MNKELEKLLMRLNAKKAEVREKAVGGACVSEKHAGFIVNKGGATCADVEALIRAIQDTVFQATGVELEPEIRRISLSE